MAGSGFKTFVTGEVLTSTDVNGYLMQGVLVFASAAARDAAITAPTEGMYCYLKDTNVTYYYDGAAWVASGATGDIEGVTAGVGISGGGTSGTVTVTNSMATAYTTKGDLVPATGSSTFSRLAVGANDTVLTADSTAATGLKWGTVASGGMTLIASGTLSGTSTSLTSIPGTYKNLIVYLRDFKNLSATNSTSLQLNTSTAATLTIEQRATTAYQVQFQSFHTLCGNLSSTASNAHGYIFIPDYASANVTVVQSMLEYKDSNTTPTFYFVNSGFNNITAAITSIQLQSPSTWGGGTYELWGQK